MIPNPFKWLTRRADLHSWILLGVMLAGLLYLRTASPELEFRFIPGGFWPILVAVGCIGLGILVIVTRLSDRLPRRGPLPVPIEGGYGWGEPRSDQALMALVILLIAGGIAWFSTAFLSMAIQAAQRADWGRTLVGALIVLVPAAGSCWIFFLVAMSRGPLLAIDGEGLHTFDEVLPWADVERIEAPADQDERHIRLHVRGDAGQSEPRVFQLDMIALPAAAFLEKVRLVAPQLEITQPDHASGVA